MSAASPYIPPAVKGISVISRLLAPACLLALTAPLFALPLGFIFLRERVTGVAVAGTMITLAGLAILQL